MKTFIMSICVKDRNEKVASVQALLTEYAQYIQTRLGLNNALTCCENNGLIILLLHCEDDVVKALTKKLQQINNVFVNTMVLECK